VLQLHGYVYLRLVCAFYVPTMVGATRCSVSPGVAALDIPEPARLSPLRIFTSQYVVACRFGLLPRSLDVLRYLLPLLRLDDQHRLRVRPTHLLRLWCCFWYCLNGTVCVHTHEVCRLQLPGRVEGHWAETCHRRREEARGHQLLHRCWDIWLHVHSFHSWSCVEPPSWQVGCLRILKIVSFPLLVR
jgi:hypothetical protein